MRVDLHTHTLLSDGARSPEDLVRAAEAAQLDLIAITDHDTLLGHSSPLPLTRVQVIIGVEYTTVHDGRELHILGYFREMPGREFLARMEAVREERRERMRVAVDRLRSLGLPVDFERFSCMQQSHVLTSAHLARHLAELRLVDDEEQAYSRYLKGGNSVVPLPCTAMPEAIEAIGAAGGVSAWAHPPVTELEAVLDVAAEAGLQGIEVRNWWRPEVDPEPFIAAATKRRLLMTGGTDYHSDTHPCPLGARFVGEEFARPLLERLGGRV